jgi:ankyrin repeat protein
MAHPEEIVEDLLEAGATANVKNKGGITPLSTGNVSIVSIKVRVGT